MLELQQNRWHYKPLILSHVIALALLGSWLFPPTRMMWDSLDRSLFYLLNGSLTWGPVWEALWAIANWRPFDLVAMILIGMILIRWLRSAPPLHLKSYLAAFILFALVIISGNLLFQLVLKSLDYARTSPSGVLEDVIRLSETVPWIRSKDYSGQSFPADHAFVLMTTTSFFWLLVGRSLGMRCMVLFVPLIFPRLVSGGHWITDVMVGSTFMTLIAMSWWFATPAHAAANRWATNRGDRALSFFESLLKKFRLIPDR